MKSAVRCELLLAGMTPACAAWSSHAPALRDLLRHARPVQSTIGDRYAWQASRYGVAAQPAPCAALADGLVPGAAYWMAATPVHLLLQRDSFALHGVADGQSAQQAQTIVDALNLHFAADGLRFFAPHPARWYVRLEAAPDMTTTSLPAALGRDIQPRMPQGTEALLWHKRLNEIQMLLHGLAVNQQLEAQGHAPVNSLWFWGGGVLPPTGQPAGIALWAQDAYARGLAQAHGDAASPLPADAAVWCASRHTGAHHLLVLDALEHAAAAATLAMLDRDWCAPLLQALRRREIDHLDIHLAGTHQVSSHALTPMDLHKFWHRTRSLEAYLD